MIEISDEEFEQMIGLAMDNIPEHYARNMKNVGITWDQQPTPVQREKSRLRGDQQLFGLYEGVPLTQRGSNYNLVLPDKITLFKYPMVYYFQDKASLQKQINKTLWHEVAHHFGLDHKRIHELEEK